MAIVSAEHEARRALSRLRRAIEKAVRELEMLEGALHSAEGADFPTETYCSARSKLGDLEVFIDDEAARLKDKILHAGGLEPGRIRRG